MTWKAGDESTVRGYKFTYDGIDRMLNATYGETASISTNANRFSENVTASAYNGGFEFKDGVKQANEYAYDANANLTKDLNKGITDIQYNCLNLPGKVTFSDGSTITYTYAANGTKLRTVHKIGGTATMTDYCGDVVYENGVQKLLLTEEGYVTLNDNKYHYYLNDHQGNNRVVINQSGAVEETNHYYPFGGLFASTGNMQPYKYNGKELDTKKGLNWYDYGARHYDAALGRFTTVDPLAEKYYEANEYTYCLNNPIVRIDPTGMASHYNWEKQIYEDEHGNEVSWESVQKEYGINGNQNSDTSFSENEVDAITGAAPIVDKMNVFSILKASEGRGLITGEPFFLPGFGVFKFGAMWKSIKNILKFSTSIGKTQKEILNFSVKAAQHMSNKVRAVPIQILRETIENTQGIPDPRGSRALMHYGEIWKNNKPYKLEILYDKKTNTIWHFQYSPIKP